MVVAARCITSYAPLKMLSQYLCLPIALLAVTKALQIGANNEIMFII